MPQELLRQFTALPAAADDKVIPGDIAFKMFGGYAMEPPDKAFQDAMTGVDPLDARGLPFQPCGTASGIHPDQGQSLLLCQGQVCFFLIRAEDCAGRNDLVKGGFYTSVTDFPQFYRLCIGDAAVIYEVIRSFSSDILFPTP